MAELLRLYRTRVAAGATQGGTDREGDEVAVTPYRVALVVWRLPRPNPSSNVHWRTKHRDRQKWVVLMRDALGPKLHPPLEHAKVTFTRFSSREPDSDNLVASFKLVRDLLMVAGKRNAGGLGLIVDDSPAHLEAVYAWKAAKPNQGRIEIVVEER